MNDEARFMELVRDNETRLRRICRTYAADAAAREDLYQDILVQLWRALPGFRGEAQAGTWLYRVALNTALGHRRRQAARPALAADGADEPAPDRRPRPDERLEARQRLDRLHAAIAHLDDVDRALVALYLDDRSYREMAEVLGISESNVGVKLHRIKKRLASWMTESAV